MVAQASRRRTSLSRWYCPKRRRLHETISQIRDVHVNPQRDVFGRALYDWARGGRTPEILEREDGFQQLGAGPEVYLSPFREWPSCERQVLRHLRGRVLDVGCGAGRVSLELQRRRLDVLAIDASHLAAKAARICGVRHVRCTTLEALGTRLSTFDSLVMFGNNFGILQNPTRAHSILKKIAETTKNDARIFVESTNAYYGGAPGFDRSYYFANKRRGVAPGQLRVRYRYDALTGSWFNWIYVSPSEMRAILVGTGWHQERVFSSIPSDPYVALLVKD